MFTRLLQQCENKEIPSNIYDWLNYYEGLGGILKATWTRPLMTNQLGKKMHKEKNNSLYIFQVIKWVIMVNSNINKNWNAKVSSLLLLMDLICILPLAVHLHSVLNKQNSLLGSVVSSSLIWESQDVFLL